ncbi:MAG TPA: alkaline phosphatase D family protein [Methylocella sp.]|nr:alkaline phosphatase D family protein [Methylocella sp.]
MKPFDQTRRQFLRQSSVTLSLGALGAGAPSIVSSAVKAAPAIISSTRPGLPLAMQLGDPSYDSVLVWGRADRPARMMVEYSLYSDFRQVFRRPGPLASEATDMTARVLLDNLVPGLPYYVRVAFEDVQSGGGLGPYLPGRFRLPHTADRRPIRFLWSGDMCGQGWGINPDFGGARIYEAMRRRSPDFFIHSGDSIYADGPISAEVTAEGGRIWKNIVTEEVSKVAETLKEFRGRYRYNMLDKNVLRFSREVPQIWQWDDHEVVNNWSPSKDLSGDSRYTEKDVRVLVSRARQAFLENAPIRWDAQVLSAASSLGAPAGSRPNRVYRHIPYGSLLDVFVLDMRSYRGPNTPNLQAAESRQTAFLGNEQIDWLVSNLTRSRAVWKVIAADMPLGLQVGDGTDAQGRKRWEAVSNGKDGPPLGRELEIARLLSRIKQGNVQNVVWITADVHYCAAHYYAPDKAAYQDFIPFWEFVAGPLNAGSFGPNEIDKTFGPQVVFQKAPPAPNTSPYAGFQFFGEVNIDPYTREMTVDLRDINGASVFSRTLKAKRI